MYGLLLQCLFLTTLMAHDIHAQVKPIDKTYVVLAKSEWQLQEIFKNIENITDYKFVYPEDILNNKPIINTNKKRQSVNDLLVEIGTAANLKFKQVDNSIYVGERSGKKEIIQIEMVDVTVTGKVIDERGEPIPGVTVLVRGTTTGIATDLDGSYTLTVPEGSTLVFSFIGFVSQEISVGNRSTIDVTLMEDETSMDEVVVVGYGTQKKATLTGAVTSVKGEAIQRSPAINLTNSLAGRLPGLTVVTRSGEPGADGSLLRIRGSNTLGDNSPLIVVDGIQNRSIERLNPADIESITVLKDASAAIYGSQAANGVILVTTKRGATGKPEVSVLFNQGISKPTVLPKMADAATYAQMTNEIDMYRNRPQTFSTENIQKFKDGSDPWRYPDTDWFAATYKPLSLQNQLNASLSGGSENIKYFVSLGSKYQDGNYRNSATNYSQVDFRSNIDAKISDNIKLNVDIAGRQENRNYPTRNSSTIFGSAMRSFPTMPANWPNGLPGPDIERGENPVVMATNDTGYDRDKRYIMQSNIKLDIYIPWINGLSITSNGAIDKNFRNNKLWQTPWHLYSWDGQTYDSNNEPLLVKGSRGFSEPRLTQTMEDGQRTTFNSMINYENSISDKHFIKFLAGWERIKGESMEFSAYRRYFLSKASQELFAGGDLQKDNSGSSSVSARLNYFGRINYNYLMKYLVEFVWRYDGSYIFPADSRFGFFPGVSLGWRISEEDFWKEHINSINDFKIRGSWGQTGNDRIEEYQYLASYGFGGSYIFDENVQSKSIRELRIPNTGVTWEIANQTNVGFDAQMFGSRLSISADYFHNYRSNILWRRNASVPSSTGLTLPRENIGEVINQGFDFELGYNNQIGDFSYQVSLNGAYQKNIIKFWDETPGVPEYQKSTGYPMNSRLLYNAIGIFKDQAAVDAYPHWTNARPGDIIFEDVNNDGEINDLDRVRNTKSDIPTFTGGLNIDLGYKNFYVNILFQGAVGATTIHYSNSGTFGNFMQEDAEGRWTEENPNGNKPRAWNFTDEYWMGNYAINNTYFLRNTDYLRLKNIEIGYNTPNSINEKVGINGLRIYLSGLNLFTIDKLENYDPETNNYTGYPPLKIYNAGISLTF